MTTHCRPDAAEGGDPSLPCGSCRKRHSRPAAAAASRRRVGGSSGRLTSLALLALVPLAAAAAAQDPVHAAGVASVKGVARPGGGNKVTLARLLAEDDLHDDQGHEHEHEDEHLFAGHDEHEHDDEHALEGHELVHEGEGAHDDRDPAAHHAEEEAEFATLASSANDPPADADESLPWGKVIGATLLVNLAALSGCLVVVFAAVQRGMLKMRGGDTPRGSSLVGQGKFFDLCIPAFAVGALVATAVFLIFPEALHLIEGGHGDHSDHAEESHAEDGEVHDDLDDHSGHNHQRFLQEDAHNDDAESASAAKFGCAILAGFLLPLVFAIFFHHNEDGEEKSAAAEGRCDICPEGTCDVETGVSATAKAERLSCHSCDDEAEEGSNATGLIIKRVEDPEPDLRGDGGPVASAQEAVPLVEKTEVNRQLCASILLGDCFHNFADGVFIGAAFKSCSASVALSIIFVTLFHEIAQELADFILLTRFGGLSIVKACALNFLSGLSVCLGGIVFLAGNPSDEATGIILAMAGGVYFNIAACETIPRIEGVIKGRWDRVWTLLSVIVGTIPIGLILLNHQHCG